LRLEAVPKGLRSVLFAGPADGIAKKEDFAAASPGPLVGPGDSRQVLSEAARQLSAYFKGELRKFDLPLDFAGTPFQIRVWQELLKIPYAETRSYAEIAAAIGSPLAVRAVGAANGANPLAIVVPCHRVVGASGKLVGYGGGIEMKRRLLSMERQTAIAPALPF
jgi:methylated-DNA-[protein]-cysteine S-methyltransferase